ncbi:MAG: deoxyribodipyrimidine photo-lyase [Pseudomonadota bacterium]
MRVLNACKAGTTGAFVLYWMQHSQRARGNPALERAAAWANKKNAPLLVLFVLDPHYPDANERHYTFMLQGLAEAKQAIEQRGAHFSLQLGSPPEIAVRMAQGADVVVTDRGYLRHLVEWRERLGAEAPVRVEMVEGDVIVPVEVASGKMEIGARTIRPKLRRALPDYLDPPVPTALECKAKGLASDDDVAIDDIPALVERLGADASVGPVPDFYGGTAAAEKTLSSFLADGLPSYGEGRADIVKRNVSRLSPYLHFGQISPLDVYHAVKDAVVPEDSKSSFIEEMLIRRELAVNFVHNAPQYDTFDCLPGWARETLNVHASDERPCVCSAEQLEAGETDDPYWNAATREMKVSGYLHNHMRMYWGKRLLALTATPQEAYATAIKLNNKYLLDGRDTNSYANIAWLFGMHDRGWPERAIFGKVRTMTASGLERKFDAGAYVRWANAL